jgi:hypothetical protein
MASTSPATCSMFCLKGESCTQQNPVFPFLSLAAAQSFPTQTNTPLACMKPSASRGRIKGSRKPPTPKTPRPPIHDVVEGNVYAKRTAGLQRGPAAAPFLPQQGIRPPRPRRVRQNDLHVNKPVGEPSDQANSFLPSDACLCRQPSCCTYSL